MMAVWWPDLVAHLRGCWMDGGCNNRVVNWQAGSVADDKLCGIIYIYHSVSLFFLDRNVARTPETTRR